MLKTQFKFIITIILVLGFSISLQSLIAAWQAPTATPPSQPNIYKPINVSILPQTKSGSFTTSGDLGVGGDAIIGRDLVVSNRMAINDATSSYNALKIKSVGANPAIYINGNGNNPEIALGDGVGNNHWAIYADEQGSDEFRLWKFAGGDIFRLKPNGDLSILGIFSGDGSNLTNVEWSNLVSVPAGFADGVDNGLLSESDPTVLNSVKDGISWEEVTGKPAGFADGIDDGIFLTQSCSEGSSIRQINDDGSVICEIDDGAATSFDNCAYDSDSICPNDTLMRGYDKNSEQAYCCGSTPISCTATSWSTYSTYCTATCVSDCTTARGDIMNKQSRTLTNCLVEYRTVDSGSNCSVSCDSGNCGGSTPYLFAGIARNNYIENDVMSTFWDVDYNKAKQMYEESPLDDYGFSNHKYRTTDYYIMTNIPSVEDNKIKLHIKEIEPEESHIDQIKLARVLYNKDSELIVDNQTNILKSVKKAEVKNAITEAQFTTKGKTKECLSEVKNNDDKTIYGNKGDVLEFKINIDKLRNKDVYLTMNSWGSTPLPLIPEVMKARSEGSMSVFFDINNDGNFTELNQIHPRELETTAHLDISDIINLAKTNIIGVKIEWTQEHWLDQVSIVTTEELEYRLEELAITKALHSNGDDLLNNVSEKDRTYGNIKQGDEIELEFIPGRYSVNDNEKEKYVFISSGFYHSLRTNLYPDLEVDNDWQDKIDAYVEELNNIK